MSTAFANQEFSSDSEDEDFIPDQKALSASEPESASEDEADDNGDSVTIPHKRKDKGNRRGKGKSKARRTELANEESGEEQGEPSAEQIRALEAAKEAERKKRIDSLWEEMKASRLDNKRTAPLSTTTSTQPKTKTITESYEFAGEKFSVTKTVPAPQPSSTTSTSTPPPTSPTPDSNSSVSSTRTAPQRRKSNLLALAAKYGLADAARLTVLEKSKLDWRRHVEEAGDAHDLEKHRKDGYLEKVDFLKRTDERQAEMVQQMKKAAKKSGRR